MPFTPVRALRAVGEQLLLAALVVGVFVVSAQFLTVSVIVPVSLMSGLGISLLLLRGRRAGIGLALGMFVAQSLRGRSPEMAGIMAATYAVQSLAGWFVVARVFRAGARFDRPREVVALACAGAVQGALGALVQVNVLQHEQQVTNAQVTLAALSLGISSLAGSLVFAPAMLAVARGGLFAHRIASRRELLGAMGLGILLHLLIFRFSTENPTGIMIFSLTVLPLLCWVAVRGTATATAVMTGILAVIVMYCTAQHFGPFGRVGFPADLRLVQTTLAPIGLFMLLLSSAEMSRRRAMRELNASRLQMERALEGSDSGLWEWRADTRRLSYDSWVARMFGDAPDVGLPVPDALQDRVHPDDAVPLRTAIRDHLAGLTPSFEVEIRHRHRDGSYVWVLDRGRVTERAADGTPLLLSGTLTDITARKRVAEERAALEERVLQAQKLEGLGLLAGGVAHDFNNILTSILGHADLARREVREGSLVQQHLDQIVAGARAAADLTRQMLAFAGRGHVATQPVSLVRLVAEMGHLLQVSISRDVTLRYDFSPNIPAVEADPAQLRQVVMNLILNAAEALGPTGGIITVRVHERDCDRTMLASRWVHEELPEGRYVILEVRDEGSGMSSETLARIFDPFFTTKFTGRGLGLAAVLGIVRGHRGSVLVETAPDRGTTFRVMLPALASSTRPEDRDTPTAVWRGDGLALVVDDEPSVRQLAEAMLRRVGFEVASAANGADALARFRERPEAFRVVLLDLTMPGMDGLAVARAMYALHPGVRVVLTTGYSAPPWSADASPAGVVGFLEKPYRLEDLVLVLRQAVETTPA